MLVVSFYVYLYIVYTILLYLSKQTYNFSLWFLKQISPREKLYEKKKIKKSSKLNSLINSGVGAGVFLIINPVYINIYYMFIAVYLTTRSGTMMKMMIVIRNDISTPPTQVPPTTTQIQWNGFIYFSAFRSSHPPFWDDRQYEWKFYINHPVSIELPLVADLVLEFCEIIKT